MEDNGKFPPLSFFAYLETRVAAARLLLAMELMQCMAKEPLHLTYRAVGSSTGQKEFVGPDDKARGVPRRPV